MGRASNVVKAKDQIVGVEVKNLTDDNLGKIEEVMLDKLTGQVAYVVLESGTFLGMGGKLFALPWNSLKYDDQKECYRIDIDKDRLSKAPGFDSDHWPDMADRTWGKNVSTYYNTRAYWE